MVSNSARSRHPGVGRNDIVLRRINFLRMHSPLAQLFAPFWAHLAKQTLDFGSWAEFFSVKSFTVMSTLSAGRDFRNVRRGSTGVVLKISAYCIRQIDGGSLITMLDIARATMHRDMAASY